LWLNHKNINIKTAQYFLSQSRQKGKVQSNQNLLY